MSTPSPYTKPWTDWNKNNPLCRSCRKRATNKPSLNCTEPKHWSYYEKRLGISRREQKEAQILALIHYSGSNPPKCVLCGYSNILALQLDHMRGDGAAFRRQHNLSGKVFAQWLRKRNWPKGHRILCANCQCLERHRLGIEGGGKH